MPLIGGGISIYSLVTTKTQYTEDLRSHLRKRVPDLAMCISQDYLSQSAPKALSIRVLGVGRERLLTGFINSKINQEGRLLVKEALDDNGFCV